MIDSASHPTHKCDIVRRVLQPVLLLTLLACGDGGDEPLQRTSGREERPCGDADDDGVCDADDRCALGDDAADQDGDGVADACDLCPEDSPDDTDGDGVCDSIDRCEGDDSFDRDADGMPDDCDSCPIDPDNDADGDGFCAGDDICPDGDDGIDADADGVPNACDPCPTDNPDDSDRDGVCERDDICSGGNDGDDGDGDGVPDACDACPADNPDDSDGDGVCDAVDVCDGDDSLDFDSDGVPDACDVCDGDDTVDSDDDGIPDACDECLGDAETDSDGDGAPDACDLCPGFDDAADADVDGVPDGCDECPAGVDSDFDGVCDDVDPCPSDNPDDSDSDGVCDGDDLCEGAPDHADADGDGVPDGCDACDGDDSADSDGDGVCDAVDDCPGGDGSGPDLDGDGVPDECEPLGGSYQYTRAEIGGLRNSTAVAFHPSGTYALILERYDRVHVFESSGAVETIDLSLVGSDRIYWSDVEFAPDGNSAILVGYDTSAGSVGAAFRFDHATYEEGPTVDAFVRLEGMATRQVYEAVVYRHDTEVETALVLSRNSDWPYQMWLDDLDPATGETTLLVASAVGAGCQDVAAVDNEFGNPGYLIVCGVNGYDGLYWTEVGGVWELRTDLGYNSLGNTSRIAGRPARDYALVVQNSSGRIHRFEGGIMNASVDAPWFNTRRIWTGAFDGLGLRALVIGQRQTISRSTFGGVLEYRHGEYDCSAPLTASCEIREVSIPNFDAPPWSTPSTTFLTDVAWRPGCDGGLIVGGKDNFSGNFGLVAMFELEGGTSCW